MNMIEYGEEIILWTAVIGAVISVAGVIIYFLKAFINHKVSHKEHIYQLNENKTQIGENGKRLGDFDLKCHSLEDKMGDIQARFAILKLESVKLDDKATQEVLNVVEQLWNELDSIKNINEDIRVTRKVGQKIIELPSIQGRKRKIRTKRKKRIPEKLP